MIVNQVILEKRDKFMNFFKVGLLNTWGFPGSLDSKESPCNAGDPSFLPELGRCLGEGNGYLQQYSCLANSMDRVAY